jgi:uncharacterized protein (DUF362 family)
MADDRNVLSGSDVHGHIDEDATLGRRAFVGAAAGVAVATTLLYAPDARAAEKSLAAAPPPGFTPFNAPGKIVKVTKPDSLQENKKYPKADDAKAMLTRAMCEFTGKGDLVEATKLFFHPSDVVMVKLNGIAEANMGTNKELVLPFLEALIAAGIPPEKITVLEQYGSFLAGTRVNAGNVPKGVKVAVHANNDATMKEKLIEGTGVRTKFVRALTESTAVVNFSLIKDHSIHGYTGLLKNMTHGCQTVPHYFHAKPAKTQIAHLYADEIIRSRVRLNITDGFKIMAHGGPLWKSPRHVVPHESVYVCTDPVAMDTLGYKLVDDERAKFKLKPLKDDGREPGYIAFAGKEHKLGEWDLAKVSIKEVTL